MYFSLKIDDSDKQMSALKNEKDFKNILTDFLKILKKKLFDLSFSSTH